MKYTQCRQCRFWVKAHEAYCPNCGAAKPAIAQQDVEQYVARQPIALIAICMSVVIAVSIIRMNTTPFGYSMGGIVITLGLLYYGFIHRKTRQFSIISPTSLTQDETLIQQRLAEIEVRRQRVHVLLHRGNVEETSDLSVPFIETLNRALTALRAQHGQYRAKLWEIALIRWSNVLKPVIEQWPHLTYDQCQAYLQKFIHLYENGEVLLQQWKETEDLTVFEKQCIVHLQHALTTVQKIRQAMQAKQAALAVQGISRFDDDAEALLSKETPFEELDLLNTLSDLQVFSSSFQDLEAEYFRLKSEEEISEETPIQF